MEVNSEFKNRLTAAFRDVFAAKKMHFPGGGLGYHGVDLENIATDGSKLDLVLTFRAGVRYCCCHFTCHFPYSNGKVWSRLRETLNKHGLADIKLPVIGHVRVVVEPGAVATPAPDVPTYIMEGMEYQMGPFEPIVENPPPLITSTV